MNIKEATREMKADSYKMAGLSLEVRNNILANVKNALIENKDKIFEANNKDLQAADSLGIAQSVKKKT